MDETKKLIEMHECMKDAQFVSYYMDCLRNKYNKLILDHKSKLLASHSKGKERLVNSIEAEINQARELLNNIQRKSAELSCLLYDLNGYDGLIRGKLENLQDE